MMQMRKATRQCEWKVYCPWIRMNLKAPHNIASSKYLIPLWWYKFNVHFSHHCFKLKYVNFITLTNNLFSFWKIFLSILLFCFHFFSHHSLNVFQLSLWYDEKFNFSHNWRNSVLRLKLWNSKPKKLLFSFSLYHFRYFP